MQSMHRFAFIAKLRRTLKLFPFADSYFVNNSAIFVSDFTVSV